jgi:hypothetical protein
VDVSAITEALQDFSGTHKSAFSDISQRQSQLLELAAIIGVQEHYRSNGYVTTVVGAVDGTFIVKTGTRGHPARYSRIRLEKDGLTMELHMNLLVRGAHDEGVYCVDVGVVQTGVVPERARPKHKMGMRREQVPHYLRRGKTPCRVSDAPRAVRRYCARD